jgi:hypothetical protein
VREAGSHRVQAELLLGQQVGRRGADQFAVSDIRADQFLYGPVVQRFVVRLEGHQVVRPQSFQAIGQASGEPPSPAAHDHHVE